MDIKYRVVFERKSGNTGSSIWYYSRANAETDASIGREEGLTVLWIENNLGERFLP